MTAAQQSSMRAFDAIMAALVAAAAIAVAALLVWRLA